MERSFSLILSLLFSIAIVIFNLSVAITTPTYIVSDLGGGLDISFYDFSFFAIGNVVGFPLAKLFRHKTYRYLLATLFLFLLLSILCATAPTYPVFLICRFFQGFCAGPFIPIQQELCSLCLTEKQKSFCSKISSLIFTLGPILGSCIGAWIAYESHWRWMFLLNIPLVLALILFIKHKKIHYDTPLKEDYFNLTGYLSYALGLTSLGLALTMGQDLDWARSSCFVTLLIIGLVCLTFFCLWEMIHPYPLLGLKFLKQPGKIFFTFITMIVFAVYFGSNFLTSKWLYLDANYTPLWVVGLVIYSVIGALVMFFLIDRFFKETNPLIMVFVSILCIGISCFYSTQFDETINFGRILFVKILESLGCVLFFLPILQLTLANIKKESEDNLVIIFHIIRIFFSGLGAALFSILLQRRQAFYHERLGGALTPLSYKTNEFFSKLKNYTIEGDTAIAEMARVLHKQATTLALDDVFYLMGWLLTLLLILLTISWVKKRLSLKSQRNLS